MEQDAGANFLAFLTLALFALLIYLVVRVVRSAKANKPATTSKPTTSEPDEDTSSRGMAWATGSGGDKELKRGRQRKPGRKWVCTRCGQQFTITVDPATVPIPWWYGEAVNKIKEKPWACTGCGTYAYTVPR